MKRAIPQGPCNQTVDTVALKYSPYTGTLGPKYILFGHMDPEGMELAKRAVLEKLFDLLKRWDVEGVVNWSLHFVVDCAYDDGGV